MPLCHSTSIYLAVYKPSSTHKNGRHCAHISITLHKLVFVECMEFTYMAVRKCDSRHL